MIANFQGGEPPFQHCSDCPEAFEDGQVQPRFSSSPPTLATSIFARGSSAVRFISAPMRRGRSASPARAKRPKSRYSRNEIPPSHPALPVTTGRLAPFQLPGRTFIRLFHTGARNARSRQRVRFGSVVGRGLCAESLLSGLRASDDGSGEQLVANSARYRTNPRFNLAILMLHNNDQGTSIAKARGKRQ